MTCVALLIGGSAIMMSIHSNHVGALALGAVVASAATAALIVLLRPVLLHYALARPNARSSHRQPTPQGGGIAVIIGAWVGIAATLVLTPTVGEAFVRLSGIFAAIVALSVIGLIDDIRTLSPLTRLVFQVAAGVVVLMSLPAGFDLFPNVPWWLEWAALLVSIVWFVNAVNFMDGVDWMTVAETLPVSGALVLFGVFGKLPFEAAAVSCGLAGAIIGFAPFNKPVAKLFLGDVGSLPIGLLLGWLLITLAEKSLTAAILLPLYYLADATITLIRRLVAGEPIMQAHRRHFYQRAIDRGIGVRQIVGHVFYLNIALVSLASLALFYDTIAVNVASGVVGCGLVFGVLFRFEYGKGPLPT